MRVLYVQFTNPGAYPPLVRGAELLVESGADVLMLGIRVAGLDALDVRTDSGIDVRLAPAAADGWRLKANYARYGAWVLREGAAWKPDWVYASDVLATPVALGLAALTGARVVYHEHDAPSLDHDSWTMRRCLAARQRLVRAAAMVVVPNAVRGARLSALVPGGREVLTVWNCPRRPAGATGTATSTAHRPDGPLRTVFRGSINAERLPLSVLHAVAGAGDAITLDIAGYETAGSRGYMGELASLAGRLGIGGRVRVLGAVPESELGAICASSDLGWAMMPPASADENMRHMTGASNKVFEYLSHGATPLVTDLPDWRSTFVEPGYALACDPRDVGSIRTALAWAASHRGELHGMAQRGGARLQSDWNYEFQFAPVLRRMYAAASRRSALGAAEAQCAS